MSYPVVRIYLYDRRRAVRTELDSMSRTAGLVAPGCTCIRWSSLCTYCRIANACGAVRRAGGTARHEPPARPDPGPTASNNYATQSHIEKNEPGAGSG